MTARRCTGALVALLVVAAAWLLWPGSWIRSGVRLEPARLALQPGGKADVWLVSEENGVVACSFRLRFDPTVVRIEVAEPAEASILDGGSAIHLPVRREPGMLEVPGAALTGGRVFAPSRPIYRFRVRAVGMGRTAIAPEEFTVVDEAEVRRIVPAAPCDVTVRP